MEKSSYPTEQPLPEEMKQARGERLGARGKGRGCHLYGSISDSQQATQHPSSRIFPALPQIGQVSGAFTEEEIKSLRKVFRTIRIYILKKTPNYKEKILLERDMNTTAETESVADVFIETLRRVDGEIESAIETLEILNDNETLRAIEEGVQDIKAGKVIRFEDFLKKHGYET